MTYYDQIIARGEAKRARRDDERNAYKRAKRKRMRSTALYRARRPRRLDLPWLGFDG